MKHLVTGAALGVLSCSLLVRVLLKTLDIDELMQSGETSGVTTHWYECGDAATTDWDGESGKWGEHSAGSHLLHMPGLIECDWSEQHENWIRIEARVSTEKLCFFLGAMDEEPTGKNISVEFEPNTNLSFCEIL